MKIVISESQYKRLIEVEEEQKILEKTIQTVLGIT